ncbi:Translation elongation factor 1 beta [Serendipita sp. 399]|nr:Translation elongation factor 1 beta [Serendipita sp. 399]
MCADVENYLHFAPIVMINRYTASQADVEVFKAIKTIPTTQSVLRWYNHIKSYEEEFSHLSGSSDGAKAFLGGEEAAGGDDEDIDLFGSDEDDDEENERIKAQRVAEYNERKSKKAKVAAKSVVTLDVKPWDDETDMAELEKSVRSIEQEGLVWGSSTLVAIGYGIKKLQITLVIEDELVSLDELQEKIAEFDDYVQSSDVAAMQKL